MSVTNRFDKSISVAKCEKTLRQFIRKSQKTRTCEASKDRHKALSVLVELAVYGVKYVNDNKITLKSGKEVNE